MGREGGALSGLCPQKEANGVPHWIWRPRSPDSATTTTARLQSDPVTPGTPTDGQACGLISFTLLIGPGARQFPRRNVPRAGC